MKQILIVLLVVISGFTFAQSSKDSVNVTDAEGKRQGKWVITNKLMKPALAGYKDDQKVEEGRYLDNKKVGIWVTYYPNGVTKSRITFENGRPFGKAIMFHENGKVAEQGIWKNNRWVGEYKLYYDNGEVQHEFEFNQNGKRDGKQVYYAENGQKIIEGEMKEGKEIGVWNEWYDNGDKRAEMVFNEGTLDSAKTVNYTPKKPVEPKVPVAAEVEKAAPKSSVTTVDIKAEVANGDRGSGKEPAKKFSGEGYAKLFRPDKQISKDGEFKKYRLITGKSYIYDNNGILERIAVFEGGQYIGDAPLPTE